MQSRNTGVFIFSQITLITTINNFVQVFFFVFFYLVCTDYYSIIKSYKKQSIPGSEHVFHIHKSIEFPMIHVHV